MKRYLVLGMLFLILIGATLASAKNDDDKILLKSRHFIPDKGMPIIVKEKIEKIPDKAHVILQLENILPYKNIKLNILNIIPPL